MFVRSQVPPPRPTRDREDPFSWEVAEKRGESLCDPIFAADERDEKQPQVLRLASLAQDDSAEEWVCAIRRGELEGLYGFGLDGVDLADVDGGDVEVFSASGEAGEAAEHGELADVGEGVGDGALHEAFDGRLDG